MMKKIIWGLGVTGLFAFAALPALSDSDNSAEITKDAGCLVYDGDGNLVLASGDITVQNNGGITTFVCKAKGLDNSTGRAVHWDATNTGKVCNTFSGSTDDWNDTVSASGNVTLVCRVHD